MSRVTDTRRARPPRRHLVFGMMAAVCLSLALSAAARPADESLARHPGESADAYGRRVLPSGAELSSKPVDVNLGSLGKIVVVLFRPNQDASNYTGWILWPSADGANAYRRYVLPPLATVDGRFSIDVRSIFAADVDGDRTPELCVLSEYHEYGSRESADLSTDCFRWNQGHLRFDLMLESGPKTLGLKNAKAVRAYFAKHPLRDEAKADVSTPGAR